MPPLLARIDSLDRATTVSVSRWSRRAPVAVFFRAVSRVGNGLIWYALLGALLVVSGGGEWQRVLHFGVTALVAVGVYKLLKRRLVRERPFIADPDICCACAPLDRYSFPSGHTLHAALFATLFMSLSPLLGMALVVFAVLTAASRMILGLHYPTDVIVGAILGVVMAKISIALMPLTFAQ
ncbi:MAG: phosphatase PAP2 family protein [Pseudomonadota bacterium]